MGHSRSETVTRKKQNWTQLESAVHGAYAMSKTKRSRIDARGTGLRARAYPSTALQNSETEAKRSCARLAQSRNRSHTPNLLILMDCCLHQLQHSQSKKSLAGQRCKEKRTTGGCLERWSFAIILMDQHTNTSRALTAPLRVSMSPRSTVCAREERAQKGMWKSDRWSHDFTKILV